MMRRHVRRAFSTGSLKLKNDAVLELVSSAGHRFNRLTDDINLMSSYMHDIRICFIALTILIYCVLIGYFVHLCFVKKRRIGGNRRSRPNWDFPTETNQQPDYRNTQTGGALEDVLVRSDGQVGTGLTSNTTNAPPVQTASYMSRNHRSAAPFMRHGRHDLQYSRTTATAQTTTGGTSLAGPNATTRLMTSDADGTVKHQIPHITTSEVPSAFESQINGPTSNGGDEDHKNGNNNGATTTLHGMPMRALHHRQMNHNHASIDNTEM